MKKKRYEEDRDKLVKIELWETPSGKIVFYNRKGEEVDFLDEHGGPPAGEMERPLSTQPQPTERLQKLECIEKVDGLVKDFKSCGIDWAGNVLPKKALEETVFIPEFDVERFRSKLKKPRFLALFKKQVNVSGYLDMFQEIYNKEELMENRIALRFRAEEEKHKREIKRKRR